MGANFLFLPFLGSSEGKRRRESTGGQHDKVEGHHDKVGGHHDKIPTANGDARKLELQQQRTRQELKDMTEEDIIADYNSPIHMWVVATLFPLTAGTFGPMASFFNICAISSNWRIIPLPPEAQGPTIQDPKWLIAVNVVSLAIAIVANISLLGQMTNRLRYNISGPITIVGFFVSGFVDVILVCIASQVLPLGDNPRATYSQAFYYACFSGGIYIILAMLLSITAWGIWFGHYSDKFKLSMSQRSLMLQTILFLAYVLAAGAVYSDIEGWSYLDSNYFVVVTLFTIGFGDLVPTTHLARSLFFPFTVGGIVFVGVIIGNIRTVVLESGSVKVSTRMMEKARQNAIKAGSPEDGVYKVRGLRGLRTRTTDAESELERRKKEFRIMREIQREAELNNRLFSLGFAIIAFSILWFIGAVAFWKAESESVGGQNWSYFESLYFTFVAQLTIGYGDFEPQTNSAKPTFVFWSMIALPTLTVLIGAVGDAVASVVNWYTVWVGEHATALYDIFVALYEPNNRARDKIRDMIKNPDSKKDKQFQDNDLGFQEIANIERRDTLPVDLNTDSFTDLQREIAAQNYRPYIMVRAAQKILEHVDSDPPKRYKFKEWTWLLKLMGEDEADEAGHRRIGSPLPMGTGVAKPITDLQEEKLAWSWLGQESPLMDLQEGSEPKWVLKRLMTHLEKELKEMAKRRTDEDIGEITQEKQEPNGDIDTGIPAAHF